MKPIKAKAKKYKMVPPTTWYGSGVFLSPFFKTLRENRNEDFNTLRRTLLRLSVYTRLLVSCSTTHCCLYNYTIIVLVHLRL